MGSTLGMPAAAVVAAGSLAVSVARDDTGEADDGMPLAGWRRYYAADRGRELKRR